MAAAPAATVRLKPTAQPPGRLAPVPPGLPAEVLIERAEWHHRRHEPGAAWQHLAALGELPSPVPPDGPVAGRAAELRAVTGWGPGPRVAADLRHAADCHLRAGDQLRHLTCLCWLGAWQGEHGDAAEATALLARALSPLREAGDPGPLAVAERLHALDLRRHRDRQAWPVLLSALGHAQTAGDPLAVGRVALTAAAWRTDDAPRPDAGYALTARDAFHAAQAPAGVVRALEAARRAFLKAKAGGPFLALIDAELARLPPRPPGLLLGYLRLRRGLGLLALGRIAPAADDLAFAVAEARTRAAERPYDVFHLAVALHGLGRIQEAADELDGVPGLLDQARERGTLTDPTVADRAHALAGECYRRLGQPGPARREYDRLAATTTRPEQRAFALHQCAQIHGELGLPGEAAGYAQAAAYTGARAR
jgi:tetratricopeptide (TPR) repeat protein